MYVCDERKFKAGGVVSLVVVRCPVSGVSIESRATPHTVGGVM